MSTFLIPQSSGIMHLETDRIAGTLSILILERWPGFDVCWINQLFQQMDWIKTDIAGNISGNYDIFLFDFEFCIYGSSARTSPRFFDKRIQGYFYIVLFLAANEPPKKIPCGDFQPQGPSGQIACTNSQQLGLWLEDNREEFFRCQCSLRQGKAGFSLSCWNAIPGLWTSLQITDECHCENFIEWQDEARLNINPDRWYRCAWYPRL